MSTAPAEMRTSPPPRTPVALRIVGHVARVIVGGLFILAAVMKLTNLEAFAHEIRIYAVTPDALSNAVALVMPWIEILTGLFLIVGIWRPEARILIAIFLVFFTALKISLPLRGLPLECGCFGEGNPISDAIAELFKGERTFLLNAGMLLFLGVDYQLTRFARRAKRVVKDQGAVS